jgi:diacylglycerol kinase (ATP)
MRGPRTTRQRAIQIVATPGSGDGRALATAVRLRDVLQARGREASLTLFAELESLRRWAATTHARFPLLVAVGGDGTVSAAALAALRGSVPFLSVPSGFGNLFARAFGHPRRVDRIVEVVEHGEPVRADVGVRNGEVFLCQESFGLLVEIQGRAEAAVAQPRARWRRWVAYYRAAIAHLRHSPLPALRIEVDGRVVATDAALVTVANVQTYGPWLRLTPEASPIDGLFDVFTMGGMTKGRLLGELLRRHLRLAGTGDADLLARGQEVSVGSQNSVPDRLRLIPRVLSVMAPRTVARAFDRQDAARSTAPCPIDGGSPVMSLLWT